MLQRLFAVLLCLQFLAAPVAVAAPRDCERWLTQKHEVRASLARAVAAMVARSGVRHGLGYGFLVGGIVTNAAVSAGVTVWVNAQAGFVPTFVGFLLGQAAFVGASLLSPFTEPLAFKIRRFTFALKERGGDQVAAPTALEAKADRIHATYTLREQYAVDRIFTFRNAVRLNFQGAAAALASGDHRAVSAELADALEAGFHYFRDIDPREPAIVGAVRASFLVHVTDAPTLRGPVLELLRARAPTRDDAAEDYYAAALDAWLASP